IAIGNPLGLLGGTVTEGIISALDRKVEVEGLSMCLIQTSAAVNPGNSGGGLFNSGGELIGIVNAKSSGQDVEGIGFAIPVNLVREIAEAIIRYGYYPGRLDIGAELSEVAEASNVSGQSSPTPGVYVSKADAGGGLHVSDRVVKVAGIPVSSLSDVYGELGRHLPGVVTFTVVRGGRDVNVRVTVRLAG
ncbi:MAG: trypsin-like peptidase domain-containing protein, partial [Oscillospiraceae bacterium]|nr:trypsin-like peptidase domain-containing protein [Oscillospiraceae bacterium]